MLTRFLFILALLILPQAFAEPSDYEEWNKNAVADKIKSLSSSIRYHKRLPVSEMLSLLQELSSSNDPDELDQNLISKIRTTTNEDLRAVLVSGIKKHGLSSFKTLEQVLELFHEDFNFTNEVNREHFYSSIGFYISSRLTLNSTGEEAKIEEAASFLSSKFSELLDHKNKLLLSRWMKYLEDSLRYSRNKTALREVFYKRFSDLSAQLTEDSLLSALLIAERTTESFEEIAPTEFKKAVALISEKILRGNSKTQIELLKGLQFWRPPVIFRPVLRQAAFSSSLSKDLRKEAGNALYFSYLGFIPSHRARGMGFYEFDQKKQILRNLRAWSLVQKDRVCQLFLSK